jgi:hypothetical protein
MASSGQDRRRRAPGREPRARAGAILLFWRSWRLDQIRAGAGQPARTIGLVACRLRARAPFGYRTPAHPRRRGSAAPRVSPENGVTLTHLRVQSYFTARLPEPFTYSFAHADREGRSRRCSRRQTQSDTPSIARTFRRGAAGCCSSDSRFCRRRRVRCTFSGCVVAAVTSSMFHRVTLCIDCPIRSRANHRLSARPANAEGGAARAAAISTRARRCAARRRRTVVTQLCTPIARTNVHVKNGAGNRIRLSLV